jgi:LAO/AO transport system kinase
LEELTAGVQAGDHAVLAQAITLVESTVAEDVHMAHELLQSVGGQNTNSYRIGVSGVPGVGKSTFLEAMGMHLLTTQENARIAVLAVDPSSSRSKGSILGDKTRMAELGRHKHAFIRPTAAGQTLGGVARATKQAMLLCEAAGFTHIFVETVGVGQSETAVAELVDAFLFLSMPGTGDELQGMKRGIMEMADIIAINKAEGELRTLAERSAAEIRNALNWLGTRQMDWHPPVLLISALQKSGLQELLETLERFRRHSKAQGWWDEKRRQQNLHWFEQSARELLWNELVRNPNWSEAYTAIRYQVVEGTMSPFQASEALLRLARS